MVAVGTDPDHAQQLADTLAEADYRGHYSHGLNRLELYINDIQANVCEKSGEPIVSTETASVARVDGNNLLGPVVGNYAMQLAMKKAKENGVGLVAVGNSNHFGIAGWYTLMAQKAGLIGISMCNTSPFCVPTRAKSNITGTNAFSVAAPAVGDDSFVLDMATTTVAIGKVEIAMRRGETIPPTWGVDEHGQLSTDPATVYNRGGLMPIGGSEEAGGYKGYGLNVMVEMFCGILGNADFGPHIRKWAAVDRPANLGQFFGAIDPSAFGHGFGERLQALIDLLRGLEPANPALPVQVAGDPERKHMAEVERLGGIPYHANQITWAKEVAARLEVEPMRTLAETA